MSSNGESSAVSSGGAENVAGTSGDMFKYTAKEIEAIHRGYGRLAKRYAEGLAQLQLTREQEDMPNPATGESRGHYTERRIRTMSRHADFSIVRVTPDIIFISDMNIGGISVTNDAEWVVKTLLEKFGPLEIVYRDSDGQWDELLHDGANFLGFSPYKGEDPEFTSIEQPDMEMKLHERRYT